MPVFERLINYGSRFSTPVRIIGSLLLIVLLFAATMYNEKIYAGLGGLWQKIFSQTVSAPHSTLTLQSEGLVGQLTNQPRNIPAVVLYSLLYLCACIALLFLILPHPQQRKLVLISYAFAGSLTIFLLLGSVIAGNLLLTLNTQLIHFIVSPMPVIILAPLLRWYYTTKVSV